MKKILLLALAVAITLFIGCGRRNAATAGTSSAAGSHQDHSACDHDHPGAEGHTTGTHRHEDEHSHGDQEGHDHSHGEACDHEGHSHDTQSHAGADTGGRGNNTAEYDPHAGHDHGEEEAADPDEIVFPPEQAARTDFKVEPAARTSFAEVIKCGGRISAAQNEISVVVAPVAGVVIPYDGRIMASTPVKKGQALFTLASGSLASGDAVVKARVNYEQAKANYDRVKALYDDKLVTQRDFLEAEAQFLTAESEYEPFRNSNSKGGTTIASPSDGYISQMSVSAGDFVEMGTPLATIARAGRMQLRALVSQRYFDRLPQIQDANFRANSSPAYYRVSELNGSLNNSGRIVSAGSSLIPVVFEMDNNGAFPDGAYVEVSLLGRTRHNVLTLPLSAITEQQGLYYVYIQLDEECYARREVILGPDDGMNVEVLSGIAEGTPVVTRGAINVKMAAASGAIPHGHSH